MIDLPDTATFAAALADRRFALAAAVAALAGLVRGFTGFGSALIYIPLIAAIYEPRIAAATLLLIDTTCTLPLTLRAVPHCHWREVLPMGVAAAIAVPFGTMALIVIDPDILRWFISALVLLLLAILLSGWRYHARPVMAVTLAAGAIAGLSAGAVQIAGPAVIVYWLGSTQTTAAVRANLMTFFVILGAASCVAYVANGLLTAEALALSLLLGAPFIAALWVGAAWFRGVGDTTYRSVAYAIVALSALVSLPVFDRLFH